MTQQPIQTPTLVICIHNADYPASLEVRKVYEVVPDEQATRHHMIRIIDESGEDYLYPDAYFLPVELPRLVRVALKLAA